MLREHETAARRWRVKFEFQPPSAARPQFGDVGRMCSVTVYVLRSRVSDRFYTGMTNSLRRRLIEHNAGRNRSTREDRPWSLVHKEDYGSHKEARQREKWLKSGAGRRWIRETMQGAGDALAEPESNG